ncbi:MAG: hypothetical protein GQ550_06445 [Gammaproteobacteria bacterium]|nr:hypothetical protein [Gammaproteobacteria bacterium]
MNDSAMDEGLIEVLLERLEKQRLPRLLEIKEKVNGGNLLEDFDIDYLEQSMIDAKNAIPIIDRHPEYQALAAKVMELYKNITEKALEIEKNF